MNGVFIKGQGSTQLINTGQVQGAKLDLNIYTYHIIINNNIYDISVLAMKTWILPRINIIIKIQFFK